MKFYCPVYLFIDPLPYHTSSCYLMTNVSLVFNDCQKSASVNLNDRNTTLCLSVSLPRFSKLQCFHCSVIGASVSALVKQLHENGLFQLSLVAACGLICFRVCLLCLLSLSRFSISQVFFTYRIIRTYFHEKSISY